MNSFLSRPPPSDESTDTTESSTQNEQFLASLNRFREDIILDFAAFESSIARIQFLRAANNRERERYAAEKLKIEQTANDVRDNLGTLRVQLGDAQRTLAVRKTYDVLAEKITKDDKLKITRAEQHVNSEKLRSEIEDLERESGELKSAWTERREQLGRVVGEAMRLRRIVRDEKDPEAETEKDGEEDGEDEGRDRDLLSNIGTPRPLEDAPTPIPAGLRGSGALTPRSHVADAATPRHANDEDVDMESGAVDPAVATGDIDKPADHMDTS